MFALNQPKDEKSQAAHQPTASAITRAVEKLNNIFAHFFQQQIISGRAYYIGDHPEKPILFLQSSYTANTITTNSWTNGKALATLFGRIPSTSSFYVNYTGSFVFSITSTDNFKTLLNFSEEELKASLQAILAQERARNNYRPAQQNHMLMLQVLTQPIPKQASITFVHPTTGIRLEKPVIIPVSSNQLSKWQAEIIKAVAPYGVTLNEADIPALKFRLNGFSLTDPGTTVTSQNPNFNIAILKSNSSITVRIPEDKYLKIQAAQAATPAVTQVATAATLNSSNTQTTLTAAAVAQPAGLLFLQSAALRKAAVDASSIETTPVVEANVTVPNGLSVKK
jgi:hypothetical protein